MEGLGQEDFISVQDVASFILQALFPAIQEQWAVHMLLSFANTHLMVLNSPSENVSP